MRNAFNKSAIVAELVRKFPELPTLTLARIIMKEHPKLFQTLNAARSSIRYVRGRNGKKNRKDALNTYPDCIDTGPADRAVFDSIPEGIKDFGDWEPFLIPEKKVLVLSDIHVPYHDKQALELALSDGKANGCDAVFINGDGIDFFTLSQFDKDPRRRDIQAELNALKDILTAIKCLLKCTVYYKLGNHEERLERYMRIKAPELLGLEAMSFESLINADEIGVTVISKKRVVRIDKLNIIHGHEFGKGIFSPVNPARGLYMRGRECALQGHSHRTSQHTETTMNGTIVACWSTGCLCDMHPEYQPMNNWNLGYAIVEQNADGFLVHNKKIINGKIYS